VLSAGFEPAITPFKRLQTYTVDRAATGIGVLKIYRYASLNDGDTF
jgi:hypothetical protein